MTASLINTSASEKHGIKPTKSKREILKLIASPLKQLKTDNEQLVQQDEKRVQVSLELELKASKHYYSITSVTNFFVGSMFELDFEKLELLFKKEHVTVTDNFRLKVS